MKIPETPKPKRRPEPIAPESKRETVDSSEFGFGAETASERKRRAERMFEAARDAVRNGARELTRALEDVRDADGALPNVIVYPESSGRLLRAAVAPALRRLYEANGVPAPTEVFFKTFSDFHEDRRRIPEAKDHADRVMELGDARESALEKRQAALRDLRASASKARREEASARAHEAWVAAREHALAASREARVADAIRNREDVAVMRARAEEIVRHVPDARPFVVDDLVGSNSRTFLMLQRAFADAHAAPRGFFVFSADAFNALLAANRLRDARPDARLYVGTQVRYCEQSREAVPGLAVGSEIVTEYKGTPDSDAYQRDLAWSDLVSFGFPSRIGLLRPEDVRLKTRRGKETLSGVTKDQTDFRPHVTRSDSARTADKRAVRALYRSWGEDAARALYSSSGDV